MVKLEVNTWTFLSECFFVDLVAATLKEVQLVHGSCIRNRWGPGLVDPPGESWPMLRVSQIGVGNLNFRVCSLFLRRPTLRPPVCLRIIGPAFGFENH